jgi:S-methylmethionine-dependent homocysteine/selenocysteine methylase
LFGEGAFVFLRARQAAVLRRLFALRRNTMPDTPRLPHFNGPLFLTDGGFETTLIFHEGWDLPMGEAFVLLETEKGRKAIRAYYERYLPMAAAHAVGFVLETPTWRANPDWAFKAAGYGPAQLAKPNRDGVALMRELRAKYESARTPIVISGNIGPRGDGYDPGTLMSPAEAADYHGWQIGIFREESVDCVSAFTMTNVNEALGFALAAKRAGLPCVISFTLETDGRLPTGETLGDAIEQVDRATGASPAYYMINCAHPTHFADALDPGSDWIQRLLGLRANSSCKSHAELDNSPELDVGNPQELGQQYAALLRRLPHLKVLGGCCGTDHRHIACIGEACCGRKHKAAAMG